MLPNVTGNHNFIDITIADIAYHMCEIYLLSFKKFVGCIWKKSFMFNKAALFWSKYYNIVK